MSQSTLERDVVDVETRDRAVARLRDAGVRLPRFSELADPATMPEAIPAGLRGVGPDEADPRNLFRVTWHNGPDRRGLVAVPMHLLLPEALSGVAAKILVVLGDRFPLIGAHKVLAAMACLVPRIVTGRFDPGRHRAVWPSTGNYCRGGVAISRIIGCRSVAVLPEEMSAERFRWLEAWVGSPDDIHRTPGSESNVKEIYDACAELAALPDAVILNQFAEFGNYVAHHFVTGRALERVFEQRRESQPALRLAAFVAATGSAGTLAAGDYLKARHGARIAAVEALECPTMLYNGYGAHNIQGIGDKHIPLIQNVMNMDAVIAVSDRATDSLNVLFNSDIGRRHLVARRGLDPEGVARLSHLGLSSICNVVASIKLAKRLDLGADDAILTVATDGAELYDSERARTIQRCFPDGFDEMAAGAVFARHLADIGVDHLEELDRTGRERIFNLGYYTWVEQQGVRQADFDARRAPDFWRDLLAYPSLWDELIDDFNARTGVGAAR